MLSVGSRCSHRVSGKLFSVSFAHCHIFYRNCLVSSIWNSPVWWKLLQSFGYVQAVSASSTAEGGWTHTAAPAGLRDYARLRLRLFCLTFINKSQGQIILPYICLQLTPAVFGIWTSCYVPYAKYTTPIGPLKALVEMPTDCAGQGLASLKTLKSWFGLRFRPRLTSTVFI